MLCLTAQGAGSTKENTVIDERCLSENKDYLQDYYELAIPSPDCPD